MWIAVMLLAALGAAAPAQQQGEHRLAQAVVRALADAVESRCVFPGPAANDVRTHRMNWGNGLIAFRGAESSSSNACCAACGRARVMGTCWRSGSPMIAHRPRTQPPSPSCASTGSTAFAAGRPARHQRCRARTM